MAEPRRRGLGTWISFRLFLGLMRLLAVLPLHLAAALAGILARIAFLVVPARRRYAREQMDRVLGAGSGSRLGGRNLAHFGIMVAEIAAHQKILAEADQRYVRVNESYYVQAAAHGGVVILLGHIGNWEMLAAGHTCVHGPMEALVKRVHNDYLNDWISDLRRSQKLEPVEATATVNRTTRYLRDGGTLVMLVDQNTMENEAVWVPFLGASAATQAGAAMLAIRGNATIIPAMGYRVTPGHFVLRYFPPVEIPGEEHPLRYRVYHGTAAMAAAVEAMVRRVPDQWLWLHKRWKQQPTEATAAWRIGLELERE